MAFLLLLTALWALSGSAEATSARVAAVGSDDPALEHPVARSDSLTADQVTDLVRVAVDRIGGMGRYVPAAARTVALKPNISLPKASGSGIVTDTRVVRAVALLVNEVAPQARILIAEAGGWVDPALQDCSLVEIRDSFVTVADGWEAAGHRETLAYLRSRGIDAELVDLNVDLLDTLRLTDGFADSVYILPQTITRADAWINLPVAKPHGAKITACIKNRFGILPGSIYGFGRSAGTSRHAGIQHAPQILDETLVDILRAAPEDLCVCDMISNTEGGAFSGEPRRTNAIVAGSDAVSVDQVAGRIMGFNPDDFEFADLAWQRGLGARFIERVDVVSDLPTVEPRFIKAGADYGGGEWAQQANYGMGERRWTLLGPLARDHVFPETQVRSLRPTPGVDGWSERVYFGHDRLDLDRLYDDPVHCAVYAATTFHMPVADSVRFWLGSDEDMIVWLDGELLYEHTGRRADILGGDRHPGYVTAGEHTVLVRVGQSRGRFDFSLNVCEPIEDERFAGNRYPGLRYAGEAVEDQPGRPAVAAINRYDGGQAHDNRFDMTIPGLLDPLSIDGAAPDSVLLGVDPPAGTLMLEVAAAVAGASILPDTAAVRALQEGHTWFSRLPFGNTWYPMRFVEIERLFDWMGLDYGISYGFGTVEAQRIARGWIAQGRPVMIGFGDDWYLADGYRAADGRDEFHYSHVDTAYWDATSSGDAWGHLANGRWVNTPVVTLEAGADPIAPEAVVDSLIHILLDHARVESVEGRSGPWGVRSCPAGLAAYDDWIIEWERFPWTREWALGEWPRLSLYKLRDTYGYLRNNYAALGQLFGWAATRESGTRGHALLQKTSDGFAYAQAWTDSLISMMPEQHAGELGPADEARYARIGLVAGMPRKIRSGVRQALTALAEMTGQHMPAQREDPLLRRDRGIRVATWSTGHSKGICDIVVAADTTVWHQLLGREPETPRLEQHAALPARPGWTMVVERLAGHGMYSVVEQPVQDNDWTVRVLMDDDWVALTNNPVELVIWAIPDE